MRVIICLLVLLGLAVPAWARVETVAVSSTIAAGANSCPRVYVHGCEALTLYGVCSATSFTVGLYVSIDGTNWKPLYSASPGDSTIAITTTSGTKLNIVTPIYLESAWNSNSVRSHGTLAHAILKVVVKNTGVGNMIANKWYLVCK